jgi:mRNA interferase HigB
MNVISMRKLRAFWSGRPGLRAEPALRAWHKTCQSADWDGPSGVRETYRHADFVVVKGGRTATVFNVKGNHIRVIALVDYVRKRMLVTHVLTHREYDSGRWKKEL